MKAKVTSKKILLKDYVDVEEWTIILEHEGKVDTLERLCVKAPDSVAALVYNVDKQQVLLVKQFRHCTHEDGDAWFVEIPAGRVEDGEKPDETIRREIKEELGYVINKIEKISSFYTTPGSFTEKMHVYYAEVHNVDQITSGGGVKEEQEYIKIMPYSIELFRALIENNELPDAKTIIAANYFLHRKSS